MLPQLLVRINKHKNLIMYKSVGEVESDRTDFVYNFYIYCTPWWKLSQINS